jgi:hypothetical protein
MRRREAGIDAAPPLDTRELQHQNVVRAIKRDHETPRRLPIPAPVASS